MDTKWWNVIDIMDSSCTQPSSPSKLQASSQHLKLYQRFYSVFSDNMKLRTNIVFLYGENFGWLQLKLFRLLWQWGFQLCCRCSHHFYALISLGKKHDINHMEKMMEVQLYKKIGFGLSCCLWLCSKIICIFGLEIKKCITNYWAMLHKSD